MSTPSQEEKSGEKSAKEKLRLRDIVDSIFYCCLFAFAVYHFFFATPSNKAEAVGATTPIVVAQSQATKPDATDLYVTAKFKKTTVALDGIACGTEEVYEKMFQAFLSSRSDQKRRAEVDEAINSSIELNACTVIHPGEEIAIIEGDDAHWP